MRLCDEGLLEEIDLSMLPPALDGMPAADDFVEGALTDCAVAKIVWSTVMAYNTDNVTGTPTTIADFFDAATYPGKRGLRKSAKATLEMSLMANGVPAGEVYDVMETEAGIDRALQIWTPSRATSSGGKPAHSRHMIVWMSNRVVWIVKRTKTSGHSKNSWI